MNFVRKHSLAHAGQARLRPRDRGAARLLQRRRVVRRQRQHADRRRRVERSRRDRRGVRAAEGLCLWPHRHSRRARRELFKSRARRGRPRLPEPRIRSSSASPTSIIMSMRSAGSAARSRAPRAAAAPIYIVDATQGRDQGPHARPSRSSSKRARGCSIRSGTKGMLKHGFEGVRNIESARHQHDGLVGDDRRGRALGLPADQRDLSCSTPRCASGSRRSIPRHRRASPTA